MWQQEQRHTNRAVTARPTVVQEGTQTSTSMHINATNETLLTQVTNSACVEGTGRIVGEALQFGVPTDRCISLSSHGVPDWLITNYSANVGSDDKVLHQV